MKKAQDKKKWYEKWWVITIFIIIILALIDMSNDDYEKTYKEYPSTTFSGVNYSTVKNTLTNSNYTDLKKDTVFNNKFKGKYIKWEGKVGNIDEAILDDLKMRIVINENTFFDDSVSVYFNEDQYNNLINLNIGEEIVFSAKFKSYYDGLLGFSLSFEEGKIITQEP